MDIAVVASAISPPSPLEGARWVSPQGGAFAFVHPALRRGDAHFALDADRNPCLRMELGEARAAIPLRQVGAMLDLPRDHPDRALIARIPAALKFAVKIAADDPIPNEIVDGSPSWVPREPYLDRAARKLHRALGPAPEEPETPKPAAGGLLASLRRHFARVGRVPDNADLIDVIGGTARADWLCRRVIDVQNLVGGLARAANDQASHAAAAAARSGALALREAAVWAGERAMRLDAMTADPVDALADPAAFRARAYPALAALRAFAIDIDGLMTDWRRLRARADGALSGEIETLAGRVIARYAKFDLRKFEAPAVDAGRKSSWSTP